MEDDQISYLVGYELVTSLVPTFFHTTYSMSLGTHRCEQAAAQLLGCNLSLGFFQLFFLCILVFLSFVDLNLKYISSHVVVLYVFPLQKAA